MMQKINLILLCVAPAVFNSCKNKTDINKNSWNSSGSDSLIKYIIKEKGSGAPARREDIAIVYQGLLAGDRLINDTSNSPDFVFRPMIINDIVSEKIPIGTKGLVGIDTKDFMFREYSNTTHYHIYFHSDTKFGDLKPDSVRLAALGMFKQIKLISADEAAKEFDKDNPDLEWRKYLDNNPLPASMELMLKDEFLVQSKYDSIKTILVAQFPMAIINGLPDGFLGVGSMPGTVIVYKFSILE